MLSKEEIETAKRYFEDELHSEKITYNCVNHYRQIIIDNHIVLYKYIEQLELDKQKLIDILEKENEEDTDTVKYYEKQRRITDSNFYKRCYQAQIHKANAMREVRKHVLEILKGENHDNQARIYRHYK